MRHAFFLFLLSEFTEGSFLLLTAEQALDIGWEIFDEISMEITFDKFKNGEYDNIEAYSLSEIKGEVSKDEQNDNQKELDDSILERKKMGLFKHIFLKRIIIIKFYWIYMLMKT